MPHVACSSEIIKDSYAKLRIIEFNGPIENSLPDFSWLPVAHSINFLSESYFLGENHKRI